MAGRKSKEKEAYALALILLLNPGGSEDGKR
jgi:hypothetical protein